MSAVRLRDSLVVVCGSRPPVPSEASRPGAVIQCHVSPPGFFSFHLQKNLPNKEGRVQRASELQVTVTGGSGV
ncbi:hypothetical protein EYF80_033572 [Liparis tanakae]|uniref:Uncharacterized protein n=1 Tax=Liparis tanakae TaxID=230148 RepID=A0A4Z2GRU2_9TELE|nr:hypothetical protein EYF80_033572 [Liparis tanakae]